MMNQIKTSTITTSVLLFLYLLVGCVDDQSLLSPTDVPVSFTTEIEGVEVSTRASNASWSADDRIGVYMIPDGGGVENALAKNIEYKALTGTTTTALSPVVKPITFPGDNSDVNFVAYYPYNSNPGTLREEIYTVDVSTQHPLSAIDLLYHKNSTRYNYMQPSVPLTFTHRLSKLNISITLGSGVVADLSSTTASLSGFPSQADFNLNTGVLEDVRNTASSIAVVKTGTPSATLASYESILIPHSGAEYTRVLSFKIGEDVYSYALPTDRPLEAGKAYNYNFTFTGNRLILGSNTITNWGNGNLSWGNNLFTCDKSSFSLPYTATTGNKLVLSTTDTTTPTYDLSEVANQITASKPNWITGVTFRKGTVANGWTAWELTFNASATQFLTARTGYIHLSISGLSMVISVNKAGAPLFVNASTPATFTLDASAPVQTFTYTTNSEESAPAFTYSLNGTTKVPIPAWLKGVTSSRVTNAVTGVSTFTTTFNVEVNTSRTDKRTCYVHYKHGTIEQRATINQDRDLSNSYIVPPGSGTIRIPVDRAISHGGMATTDTFTAAELWDDNNVVSAVGVSGSGSTGYITVNIHATNQGNALVALKVGGITRWSWHIWVTSFNSVTAPAWSYNGYTFMDRNLGATDNTFSLHSRGLFYQWGRKDPSPQVNIAGFSNVAGPVSLQTSIQNPEKFYFTSAAPYDWNSAPNDDLWGYNAGKTAYDPCPVGWRVPSRRNNLSPWNGLTDANFDWKGVGKGNQFGSVATSMYPAAGYRDCYTGNIYDINNLGYYRSASPINEKSHVMVAGSNIVNVNYVNHRGYGFSVRCVKE